MASLLTHKDLSRLLGVSETTVKSYRRKFPGCVPVANEGKPIRFTPEAADVCKRIRDFFELGMAVAEIRHRLSEEFDWIDAEEPKRKRTEKASVAPEDGRNLAVFQPVATSVASLAKSMVGISQQQNSILKRLEGLETRFENTDAQRASASDGLHGIEGPDTDYADRLARIEHNISVIESLLRELVSVVAAQERKGSGIDAPAGRNPGSDGANAFEGDEAHAGNFHSRHDHDARVSSKDEEKFHVWSGLPLFAKNEQGQYGNVAGRGRAHFSINDLRAALAHRISPPDHYAISWRRSGQETWLLIELSSNLGNGTWRLLLTPARTIKGVDIIVAERVFSDGNEVPAAKLHEFVAGILG